MTAALAPASAASLLRDGRFLRIWLVGLATGVGRWLELLVAAIYAFDATGSPFLVALLILLRMAPFALFGPLVGAFADRLPPRLFLASGLTAAGCTSGLVLVLFMTGLDAYWVVALACTMSGLVWTTDMPLRRRMLGDIAGPERLAAAMGLDSATSNGTRLLGPLAGGALYAWVGAGGAFGLSALLYVGAALLVAGLPAMAPAQAGASHPERMLRQMREAVLFARRERDMLAILAVTVIYNVWCFPLVSMVPVIGAEVLRLDPFWIGAVAAMEGAGALFGALVVAVTARPAAFRAIYVGGTLAHMVFAFAVGTFGEAVPVALALLCVGLASSCFGTMQSTLVYAVAPPAMRGRLFGLLVLCIGSGLLGFANIGLMGEWFGPDAAVRIVAAQGVIPLLVVAVLWRRVRRRA